MGRDGKSKTIFANFLGLCLSLQRDKKHVMQFIRDELMVKCSFDVESTKMVIEGGFKRQDIAKIIDQYKTFFVICHSCKSFNTILRENKNKRSYMLSCNECGLSRPTREQTTLCSMAEAFGGKTWDNVAIATVVIGGGWVLGQ